MLIVVDDEDGIRRHVAARLDGMKINEWDSLDHRAAEPAVVAVLRIGAAVGVPQQPATAVVFVFVRAAHDCRDRDRELAHRRFPDPLRSQQRDPPAIDAEILEGRPGERFADRLALIGQPSEGGLSYRPVGVADHGARIGIRGGGAARGRWRPSVNARCQPSSPAGLDSRCRSRTWRFAWACLTGVEPHPDRASVLAPAPFTCWSPPRDFNEAPWTGSTTAKLTHDYESTTVLSMTKRLQVLVDDSEMD